MIVPEPLRRVAAGLRFRVLLVVVVGLACVGIGFQILLVTTTRGWLYQELESRSRSIASLLAERSLAALLTQDEAGLAREIARADAETDLVGTAIYRADGTVAASSARLSDLWLEVHPPAPGSGAQYAPLVQQRQVENRNLIEVLSPILRRTVVVEHAGTKGAPAGTSGDAAAGAAGTPVLRRELVGWVRVVTSPERLEQSVRFAGQAGVMVLLTALLLGLLGVAWLGHVVVEPIHEASGLASEIAAGNLHRRLPVRGRDELSTLARSMNIMSASLLEAQERIEAESNALQTATRAVVAIARSTQAAHDPGAMFAVVAYELKRVTGCDAVALAVPREADRPLVFRYFDPVAPWGGLEPGTALDNDVLLDLRVPDGSGARLSLDHEGDRLSRGLARGGYQAAMLVPLVLESEPQAVLLLASRDAEAFPPAKADVVAGISTHLSAALHVAMLNDQLQHAIEELQRTHECLIQSEMLRVAGEMATGVAHEFNNLLASILGRAQILSVRLHGGRLGNDELLTSLRVIERAAKDGSEIGRRLRQFGHGASSTAAQPVHLDSALLDAIEFTRPRWENEAQVTGRHIEVMTESWSGAYVMGHGNELREVFTNLILNAVDALPEGGSIRLATTLKGDSVVACVEDNGIGMDETTKKRLFEPFFTTKGEGGSGLGLSVAYGIIKRHGATIEVSSEPGRGTRIEIAFPRAKEAPHEEERPTLLPEQGARKLSIMVVDDDQRVRDVLRDMVEALGHQVTAFESGDEALKDYQPGRYDLILTDLGMPGITGWKLTQLVRAVDPTVTIAFVTGWGDEVRPETVERAGVDHVVAKPFTFEDVAEVTRLAAERADARNAGEPPAIPKAA